MRRLTVTLAALVALALPAGAAAAGTGTVISPTAAPSPFTPGVPQATTPLPSTDTGPLVLTAPNASTGVTSTSPAGGFSGVDAVLIGAGVALLIGGIAYFVWRDSRQTARRLGYTEPAAKPAAGTARPGSKAAPPKKLSAAEKRRRKRGRAPRRR